MIEKVGSMDLRIAQLLGNDNMAAVPPAGVSDAPAAAEGEGITAQASPFDDILGRAINALNGVSRAENNANQMIDKYVRGEVDLQDVMVQSSKMNIMVQMAVTTVNLAVNTFKEVTQMQV
ncbi:MAG TPA: flagellar hook-basal body complex protein FliE [Candidatus Omnitrophota bacterium]|nr:flagellar hook-basal body complex protein FliE [Candidatus Omnitrophota bacterium]